MTRRWQIGPVFVLRHAGMPFDWLEELSCGGDLLRLADAVLDAEDALAATDPRATDATLAAEPHRLPPGAGTNPAADRWREALAAYRDAYTAADADATTRLATVLARDRVPEAVYLSNPDVYHHMLRPFLDRRGELNSRWRRVRRQLYTYVQRFCAKNETVSFFGPMGYGTTTGTDGAVLHRDRPQTRRVFFAAWAARELARAIAADRRLMAVLPVRPTGDVDLPGGSLTDIARATERGLRDAATGVQALVGSGDAEFGVAPAPYDLDPLASMLDQLAALPPGEARDTWIDRLRAIDGLVETVQETPFPDRIAAVDRLEQAFAEATGVAARRGEGAVYADRAVFYEECASPFALEVGDGLMDAWARRLGAAMELSTGHGNAAWTEARRLVAAAIPGDGEPLDLVAYNARAKAAFDAGGSRFAPAHTPAYPAPDADDLVRAGRACPGDRYATIDLCPAAGSEAGLATAPLVLSRCHHQLLTDGWLATMYGDRDGFAAAARDWLRTHPDLVGLDVGRRNKGYYRFPGRRIALRAPSHADAHAPGVLRPASVMVRPTPDGPRCYDGDGTEISVYLPLTDYVKYPPYAAISAPQVLHASFGGDGDTGAVVVDGVVYQRPRWTLDPEQVTMRRPEARFLALRRLARRAGGRFVFCRSAGERKPYLIDLESVLAADLVAHVATGPLTAEAMMPGPDGLWLRDTQGRRYTCELRMQIVGRDGR